MKDGPEISRIAALIGDPARANILTALMDGRALTGSELAGEAGVALSTASGHLSKLTDGGLVRVRAQGRHRYFSLAGAEVAGVLEALMGLSATQGGGRVRTGPKEAALREARVCYNHLAGTWGIKLFEALASRDLLREAKDAVTLTAKGETWATDFGIDLSALQKSRAPLCRPCLDWSERRTHLGGSLGRAVFTQMEARAWVKRTDSRAVRVTQAGQVGLKDSLGVAI